MRQPPTTNQRALQIGECEQPQQPRNSLAFEELQGGAYGCFARYGRSTGAFTFASYRDPNVAETLKVYRATADYLGNLSLSEADITRAVVGAIGDVDAYMLPGAKGSAAFSRWMCGETDEERQRIRDEILSTRLSDFHDFAPCLAKALEILPTRQA